VIPSDSPPARSWLQIIGDGSALETLHDAIENLCRMYRGRRKKILSSLSTDYAQFLTIMHNLRINRVSASDMELVYPNLVKNAQRGETKAAKRPHTTGSGKRPLGEGAADMISKDEKHFYAQLQGMLRNKETIFKRVENRNAKQIQDIECKSGLLVSHRFRPRLSHDLPWQSMIGPRCTTSGECSRSTCGFTPSRRTSPRGSRTRRAPCACTSSRATRSSTA
jgi:hypothetical protein